MRIKAVEITKDTLWAQEDPALPHSPYTKGQIIDIGTEGMSLQRAIEMIDAGRAREASAEQLPHESEIVKEPETKEPETKEPETKEPETKEPETKEPEIKEPEKEPDTDRNKKRPKKGKGRKRNNDLGGLI